MNFKNKEEKEFWKEIVKTYMISTKEWKKDNPAEYADMMVLLFRQRCEPENKK